MRTKAAGAATPERPSHLAPVSAPADPLFVAISAEWIMDASIPIEIRVLCQMILAKALMEAKEEGRDFTAFGRDQVTTKINVNWIIERTGWPKGKAEGVRAEALEKGYLSVSGSARTGYRYTIMLSLRTHHANMDIPAAKSMFASEHTAPNPKPSSQLELGDVGSAVQPPPDMKRWSRADRAFYSRSSGAIRTVFSRLSGAERKLFSRLSGADQEICSRSPGANGDLLSRLAGANDELCSRRSGVKKGLYKVRARSQEYAQNHYQNLLADTATPEIRNQLLLLARKREEDTEEDSATFVKALGRIIETLNDLCENDLERVRETLSRVTHDERVTSHENPIAMMLRGVCNKPRFLLVPRASARIGKSPDERAYYLLPEPVQKTLRRRIELGSITPEWCRERDISEGARRAASAIVERASAAAAAAAASPALSGPMRSDPGEDGRRVADETEAKGVNEKERAERADSLIALLSADERAALRENALEDNGVRIARTSVSQELLALLVQGAERRIILGETKLPATLKSRNVANPRDSTTSRSPDDHRRHMDADSIRR